ncbi:MAG: hypothetical protein LBP75_05150 [Planctomycetota bacterium]|nr:hypothetical protein [Planctomycetota bacterium]
MRLLSTMCCLALGLTASAADRKEPAKEPTQSVTLTAETLPQTITEDALKDVEFLTKYFVDQVFSQKMQLENGLLSEEDGKVLTLRKDKNMIIAFYAPNDEGEFVLVGNPTVLSGVLPVRASVNADNNLPCLVVKKIDDAAAWRIYLRAGQVVREEFIDETEVKK